MLAGGSCSFLSRLYETGIGPLFLPVSDLEINFTRLGLLDGLVGEHEQLGEAGILRRLHVLLPHVLFFLALALAEHQAAVCRLLLR